MNDYDRIRLLVAVANAVASGIFLGALAARRFDEIDRTGIGLFSALALGLTVYWFAPGVLIEVIGIVYLMLFTGINLSLLACVAFRGAGIMETLLKNMRNKKG